MGKNNKNLFTNKDWTEEEKDRYFKQYIKLKHRLRSWYKAPVKFREVKMYRHGTANIGDSLWENIIDEQTYEPMIQTKLTAKIW